jgi:hypothetical protein
MVSLRTRARTRASAAESVCDAHVLDIEAKTVQESSACISVCTVRRA